MTKIFFINGLSAQVSAKDLQTWLTDITFIHRESTEVAYVGFTADSHERA